MMIEYYLYYFYYTFLGFPLVIRIAVLFTTIACPFILFCIVRFIHIKNKTKKYARYKKRLEEKYQSQLSEILSDKRIYIYSDIHNLLKADTKKLKKRDKQILTDIFIELSRQIPDLNNDNYTNAIEYFRIPAYWEREINYGNTATKYNALCKFDEMHIDISGSVITPITYSRNKPLRKKARASFIHLNKHTPFKFFGEDFDCDFNSWDKIEIHRFLSLKRKESVPLLTQWIKSAKNNHFICFLIDEIKILQQKECAPFLHTLIESDNLMISEHCIDALGELMYRPAEKTLIEKYPLQPLSIQQSIIRTVSKLKTGKALLFLEKAYQTNYDNENEKIILKAIYNYGEEGRKLFDGLKKKAVGFSKLAFDHVSNPLIKFV
ncbi:hypothetical protein [Bacteroides sp. 519]|uniref:hypothetical protein n=1 Tax=Bacteroides sp. 519 TaxID=2302937 RepID=UPI0013D46DE5|nr:hypothetical protein [Bacteroides sp. 519]